ncbi:tensin-3 isoform X2 [Colossoma macropomum]|uniref:tensin-3 isoform X2 n=1 Tax=Colossoma macropomum TaxID=42526 RepID=UPI0018650A4C|nr:tensin-3 isoform X2 [Colossoma macropomum]
MADASEFDLDYITERIIAVSFHQACPEQTYVHNLHNIMQMLQSKHADNYLVVNLSEPREELRRMNTRVLDVGWPEQHAPSLRLLCSMCKSIENWLSTHTEHVLLLHCRGSKDRVGVVISSYINLPSVSTSEEQALDCYTMKRFYNDKMASLMTPSQKRYVQMFGSLLNRQLKINSSPLLFHCITLHHIPKLHPTGCQLFVRVYQGMQTVCTTGVHKVAMGQTDRVYFALEPPQLLKGDIMIVCYHKNAERGIRELVFRMQFHTGTLHGHPSLFYKKDLDLANKDPRFPENGEVEAMFSESMVRIPGFPQGSDGWRNSSAVVIDYNTLDPLVHWDSYENIAAEAQPSERAPSVSSDSGLSSNSQWTGGPVAGLQSGHSPEERTQLQRAITVDNMEGELPHLEVITTELMVARDREKRAAGERSHHLNIAFHVNGETATTERETDILDDENGPSANGSAATAPDSKEADHELPSLSLAGSVGVGDGVCPASNEVYSHGVNSTRIHPHSSVPSGFQTHIWVRQQQLVTADTYMYPSSDRLEQKVGVGLNESRGNNSTIHSTSDALEKESEAEKDDEFASLALDIDQSIEQLNQLILDLDPEFEPVPTRARGHIIRSASLHTNGIAHSAGQAKSNQSGIDSRQISDVTNQSAYRSPAGDLLQALPKPAFSKPSQYGGLYGGDTVDYEEFTPQTDRSLWVDLNQPPSTPAFPVSPPTPYVKSMYDFSHMSHSPQPSAQHLLSRTQQESRGYVDSMTHVPMSSDGDLFRSEMTSSPTSCQRMFGSMRSVNTPSPLPINDSPTAAHSWLESGSNTPLSHYTPQPSPPLPLSAPNAHSSPRGGPRGLPSSLGVGSLELSLLEAMEGLESLGLDGIQPPLLPQKRRGVDVGELSLNSSLSRSAVSASFSSNNGSPTGSTPSPDPLSSKPDTTKFVQDTSKFWYKPDISREQAIALLKDKEPGSFIVRDSHSFRGAYGLAMKVATPPPSVLQQSKKGDLTSELVRHFLIECTQKGVRLKGCPNEPYFGSLTALVCQHSITPLALPCKLIIPARDPLEELTETQAQTSTNSATELLKQGAACNVWFLGSVELESLTGVQAIQKATTVILGQNPPAISTIVHFKVSAQGITLTDNQRKLFFRRHYAVNTVIFCALDPQDRKWMRDGCLAAKIFGFVARKSGSSTENVCHLFAEHDPEQPASAIVNFVSKVMIGSQKAK